MEFHRKVKVIINGRQYLVEVGELSHSPLTVRVNGRPYQVDVEVAEEVKSEAFPPPDARQPEDVATQSAAGASANTVISPMPGNIVNILVIAGDRVTVNQILCTLEAMKMQNAIRSPVSGVITNVIATSGQAVDYGDVLFTFE